MHSRGHKGCFELNEEIFLKPLVLDRAWSRIGTQLALVVSFGLTEITEEMAENRTEVKILFTDSSCFYI